MFPGEATTNRSSGVRALLQSRSGLSFLPKVSCREFATTFCDAVCFRTCAGRCERVLCNEIRLPLNCVCQRQWRYYRLLRSAKLQLLLLFSYFSKNITGDSHEQYGTNNKLSTVCRPPDFPRHRRSALHRPPGTTCRRMWLLLGRCLHFAGDSKHIA